MKLSAAIMAHPVRAEHAEHVQAALDRPVEIIYDTVATPSKDPQQRWATGRRAWEAFDPTADWHMVIQDDALPCADLMAGLERALAVLGPRGLVSAFAGEGRPDQRSVHNAYSYATRRNLAWMCTRSLCWGVAIIAPTATIPRMLRWCSMKPRHQMTYDMRVGLYYRDVMKWRTWYPLPSLVDHRHGPSLVGHGSRRNAAMFHQGSALEVDFTRTPPHGLPLHA